MMKRLVLAAAATIAFAGILTAQETKPAEIKPDPKVEKMAEALLPVCADAKLSWQAIQHKLPGDLAGSQVIVSSSRPSCQGEYLSVTSSGGGFFLGLPWFLDGFKGTIEQKLKDFTLTRMQDMMEPTVDRTKTRDGLYKVTLVQTTARGKLPLEGEVDPDGTVFFFGHFRPTGDDPRANRLAAFSAFIPDSPTTGAAKPKVTVIEFSDFECPSCQHASGYMKPILDKYGDSVRYIRYDLPLISMHPWALAAAISGRAVYRQKPDLFWEYKKQVYANQDQLSAFTIDDFTRGFAQDHDLDMKRYAADVASEELKSELIKGVGAAFSNDIRATPSYVVNGALVDPGPDGKALETYVAGLLK